jgi:serine phosphatase RsbU (regulator of sigma subunit)
MRKGLRIFSAFVFILFLFKSRAQSPQRVLDSLLKDLARSKADSTKVLNLLKVTYQYNLVGLIDSATTCTDRAIAISRKANNPKWIVQSLLSQVNNYKDHGKFKEAESILKEAFEISQKEKILTGEAGCWSAQAMIHSQGRNYAEAEKAYLKAVELYQKAGGSKKTGNLYNSMGVTFGGIGSFEKASKYYLLALAEAKKDSNYRLLGMVNLNLSELYSVTGDMARAEQMLQDSYKYYMISGDIRGAALAIGGLSSIAHNKKQTGRAFLLSDSARVICIRSKYYTGLMNNYIGQMEIMLELLDLVKKNEFEQVSIAFPELKNAGVKKAEEFIDKKINRTSVCYDSIRDLSHNTGIEHVYAYFLGRWQLANGNNVAAVRSLEKAVASAELMQDNTILPNIYLNISTAYRQLGKYERALFFMDKLQAIRDSLAGDDKNKAVMKNQAEFDFKQKEAAIQLEQEKEKIVYEAQKKHESQQRIFFLVIFLILGVGFFLAARAYKRTRSVNKLISTQKDEIEKQKHLVDEKNREVTDSITYAKRLQEAILPSRAELFRSFNENFVLYLPKDIVAGDFYWMHRVNDQQVLIAVADCTGHGVPGAMVSVVCSNALNRSVNEFKLKNVAEILDKTRELVIETFAKTDKKVRDGMDISLLSVTNKAAGKITVIGESGPDEFDIDWAGANNPLWYFKNGEFAEIKANKQPVGKTENMQPFTKHSFKLHSGDTLYLFSDGYSDQFGGEGSVSSNFGSGKKMKSKQFAKLIQRIQELNMYEQVNKLEEDFVNWRGSIEQIDDVLVMGVKL